MPLIKTKNKLILYCHIPKCGGTTVTNYLKSSGFKVGLVNTSFKRENVKWSKTSPQHIEMKSIQVLNLKDLIDESFAVVRHPVSRFVSAFHYNKKNGKIPFWMNLNQFLKRLSNSDDSWHFKLDNHFRPMFEFVDKDTNIVKLENGEEAIVNLLNKLTGSSIGVEKMKHTNPKQEILFRRFFSKSYLRHTTSIDSKESLTSNQLRTIINYYHKDFDFFSYEY